MKIVIFADLHYCNAPGKKYNGVVRKLTEYALPMAERIIDTVNRLAPDLVVNLGDLIEDIDTREDIANLKKIWRVFQRIKPPFYSVNGNHDIHNVHRAEVAKIMGYHNPTFSLNLGGYHFVFLGLSDQQILYDLKGFKMKRAISDEDLAWFSKDVKANRLPSVVFLHHGVAEDEMNGNWWFGHDTCRNGGLLYNRAELKKILRGDKNLLAVFSGHQHWTKSLVEDGIVYYVIGSLVENINSDGRPDGIWFEVDIAGRNVSVRQHHFGI